MRQDVSLWRSPKYWHIIGIRNPHTDILIIGIKSMNLNMALQIPAKIL